MNDLSPRDYLLSEGVSTETIDSLESVFLLNEVIFSIHWSTDDSVNHSITLACPKCGSTQDYELDAVTDFFCPEDDECGFDYGKDFADGLKPLIA